MIFIYNYIQIIKIMTSRTQKPSFKRFKRTTTLPSPPPAPRKIITKKSKINKSDSKPKVVKKLF